MEGLPAIKIWDKCYNWSFEGPVKMVMRSRLNLKALCLEISARNDNNRKITDLSLNTGY
jgi:hypothetical protein